MSQIPLEQLGIDNNLLAKIATNQLAGCFLATRFTKRISAIHMRANGLLISTIDQHILRNRRHILKILFEVLRRSDFAFEKAQYLIRFGIIMMPS